VRKMYVKICEANLFWPLFLHYNSYFARSCVGTCYTLFIVPEIRGLLVNIPVVLYLQSFGFDSQIGGSLSSLRFAQSSRHFLGQYIKLVTQLLCSTSFSIHLSKSRSLSLAPPPPPPPQGRGVWVGVLCGV
jgi:hypothetical protein